MSSNLDRPMAYGGANALTIVDRFGVWLSSRKLRKYAGGFEGKRVADIGCGYDASFARSILNEATSTVLCDVDLATDLQADTRVIAIEGVLPDAIKGVPSHSVDVVMCVSVLEHLDSPEQTLLEFRRIIAPGGVVLLNVPNWRGKRALELSAFKLGLSPADSIDDHKCYYDPEDLWPMLVRAGFRPRNIKCFRHKFGLNTFAVCRAD